MEFGCNLLDVNTTPVSLMDDILTTISSQATSRRRRRRRRVLASDQIVPRDVDNRQWLKSGVAGGGGLSPTCSELVPLNMLRFEPNLAKDCHTQL